MTSEQEEQALRKEVLRNDVLVRQQNAGDRQAATYFGAAIAASEEMGGRFAAVGKSAVVGSSAVPQYPRLPESHAIPWPEDRNPLGFAINDMGEPSGSPAEVERAAEILRERQDPTAHSPAVDCAAVTLSAATVSLAVGEPIVTAALQSKSPPITGAAVGGDAGDSAANSVPRTSLRRL